MRCPPKMMSFNFYRWQLRKRHHFWWASQINFSPSYFVRALVWFHEIFLTIEDLEKNVWNLISSSNETWKKAFPQLYFCYRCPMGGLKLACWPRYWLCACSISLMEQTLLWRLRPSHMMSLVKTDGQMEAVSTSLNAFLLLKKRHFDSRVSRCWIQN